MGYLSAFRQLCTQLQRGCSCFRRRSTRTCCRRRSRYTGLHLNQTWRSPQGSSRSQPRCDTDQPDTPWARNSGYQQLRHALWDKFDTLISQVCSGTRVRRCTLCEARFGICIPLRKDSRFCSAAPLLVLSTIHVEPAVKDPFRHRSSLGHHIQTQLQRQMCTRRGKRHRQKTHYCWCSQRHKTRT